MSTPLEPSGPKFYTDEEEEFLNSQNELHSLSGPSSRPSSPSPSLSLSTYTYVSSVDGHTMLRDIAGRAINATSDAYIMPADELEHSRLDLQHECFRRKLGGLFLKPDAVRRALAPNQDVTPTILDIGTGSGTWAIDMARHFPHCQVTGLDLVPANLSSSPPSNCRFECDDANLGLKHYANSFNVVHGRLIATGITNYRALVADIANMLRPGGVYLSMEVDWQAFNENFDAIAATDEDEPGFTWLQKTMLSAYSAFKERTPTGPDAGPLIPKWLKSMDCWSAVGHKPIFIPIGAWDDGMNEKQRKTADMMKHDTLELLSSIRPLLLAHGYFEETVDKWLTNAKEEVRLGKKKQCWRLHYSWAIKNDDPSQPKVLYKNPLGSM